MAWRSVLLPARCFTRTVSLGWHHLTSIIREDLNAAQDVVRRSSSAKTDPCVARQSDECRSGIVQASVVVMREQSPECPRFAVTIHPDYDES